MKNILMTTLLIFGVVAVATADPILNKTANDTFTDTFQDGASYGWYTNSGEYLGTFDGNDTINFLDDVEENLESIEINTELTQADVSYTTTSEDNGEVLGTYKGPDGTDISDNNASRTGTWTALPLEPTTTIEFYSVKAGSYYSIYRLDPAQSTGSWSTYDMWNWGQENDDINGLGGKGGLSISHFSGFNPGTTPVPEPAAMLLLGTGLAALAGLRRRTDKKQ